MEKLEQIIQTAIEFRNARDWKKFHDPKNLSEAISIESAELLEKFLWKSLQESKAVSSGSQAEIEEEVADIMIYLIYLCDSLNIDLLKAVDAKIKKNQGKYPVDKSKGNSKKYSEL